MLNLTSTRQFVLVHDPEPLSCMNAILYHSRNRETVCLGSPSVTFQFDKCFETYETQGLLMEYPDLEGRIEYADLGTACTNDYYLGTVRGAVYGRE